MEDVQPKREALVEYGTDFDLMIFDDHFDRNFRRKTFSPQMIPHAQGHTFKAYPINSSIRRSFAFEKKVYYLHPLVQLLATGKTTQGFSCI